MADKEKPIDSVKSEIDGIKTQDDLKKVLLTEAERRIAAEEKADKLVDELKAFKEESAKQNAELREAMTKNWTEKHSTKDTKEETLYSMGMFIKGIASKDRELVKKFGYDRGAEMLAGDREKAFGDGQWTVQKSKLGTPLYSDATTGSYLVPVEYAAEVMYVAKQASQMMGQVREIPMSGITKYVPTPNAAASCYWLTLQSSSKSEVNPTFGRATLTSQTMGIYTTITDELQEDSIVAVASYFRDIFGEAWGYEFDYQCTQSSANPFTGMLAGAGVNNIMAAGKTSFENVEFDDLYDMVGGLTTVNKRIGGKFIMHCTVFDILRKVKDANGNYIYQPPNGSQPGTLCGYPYIITDGMTPLSSDAVSTKFLVFGNPKYFLFGNRMGLEFKVFDQTAYAATEDQIIFRARARAAFTVGISGAFVSLATPAA